MCWKKHWKYQYIINRLKLAYYQKINPSNPWWNKDAIKLTSTLLRDFDYVLEWGSGKSTIWLSGRIKKLVSIEHNELWFEKIRELISQKKIDNVDLIFLPSKKKNEYYEIIKKFPIHYFSVIIIDGYAFRDKCSLLSIDFLAPGGLLIIDNVERYLPSESRSPESIGSLSEFPSKEWQEFFIQVKNWRYVWTTDGVTDTCIWIKPT